MNPEDESVTHVERPVRFHTSLEELKEFLGSSIRGRGGEFLRPEKTVVGYEGDDDSDDVEVSRLSVAHYTAKKVLKHLARLARNRPGSVVRLGVENHYKGGEIRTLGVLAELMPLSLAETADIDRLAGRE